MTNNDTEAFTMPYLSFRGRTRKSKCHFDEQRWISGRVRRNLMLNAVHTALSYKISPRTSFEMT